MEHCIVKLNQNVLQQSIDCIVGGTARGLFPIYHDTDRDKPEEAVLVEVLPKSPKTTRCSDINCGSSYNQNKSNQPPQMVDGDVLSAVGSTQFSGNKTQVLRDLSGPSPLVNLFS